MVRSLHWAANESSRPGPWVCSNFGRTSHVTGSLVELSADRYLFSSSKLHRYRANSLHRRKVWSIYVKFFDGLLEGPHHRQPPGSGGASGAHERAAHAIPIPSFYWSLRSLPNPFTTFIDLLLTIFLVSFLYVIELPTTDTHPSDFTTGFIWTSTAANRLTVALLRKIGLPSVSVKKFIVNSEVRENSNIFRITWIYIARCTRRVYSSLWIPT